MHLLNGGQRGQETIELGWIYIADRDQAKIAGGGRAECESGAG